VTQPPTPTAPGSSTYAGQRLGLPETGPGSVAGWGRRVLALFVDWLASLLVARVLLGPAEVGAAGWRDWMPMLVFLLETTLLTALVGGSFGQLVLRVAVVRLDRKPVTLLHALVRTVLICLVVPPLVFNRDQRGLHDLAVGTVTLRR
jgi:uncharacterized RDD family membrane protein YckC